MGKTIKDLIYTTLMGKIVPLLQHEKKDGSMVLSGDNNPLPSKRAGISAKTVKPNIITVSPLSSTSTDWIDTDGFDAAVVSAKSMDGSDKFHFNIEWSDDGVGVDTVTLCEYNYAGTKQYPSRALFTRKRWLRVILFNDDAAAAHTLSASIYLKA